MGNLDGLAVRSGTQMPKSFLQTNIFAMYRPDYSKAEMLLQSHFREVALDFQWLGWVASECPSESAYGA
jgi:hypothetical protein